MKKIIIAVIAALGMISATVTFADALNGAAGKKAAAAAENKNSKLYATDVFVLNRLDTYVQVQNVNYVYNLNSGDFKRFPADSGGRVPLYIVSPFDNLVLLNGDVCNRAIITLKYDQYHRPAAFVDGSQCYKK